MCSKICSRLKNKRRLVIYLLFKNFMKKRKKMRGKTHGRVFYLFFSKQVITFLKHVIYRPDYRVCLLHEGNSNRKYKKCAVKQADSTKTSAHLFKIRRRLLYRLLFISSLISKNQSKLS